MYHMSVKTVSRAKGSSAVASASYRSGKELTNERTGEVHDYTRKQGVEHAEIVLPPGAPEWATDRSTLWSAAEFAEKRKDATVAREFEVAIPKELTKEQGIELALEFAAELVERHGFAADVAVHRDDPRKWDGTEKGYVGYHAHILCSTRRLTPEGFGDKTRELDGMKAGREQVEHWRERWEIVANKHLERAGHDQRIDRRNLKEQGIAREPTQHLGTDATAMERKGERTEIGDTNRKTQQERQQSAADRQTIATIEREEAQLKTGMEAAQKERERLAQENEKPVREKIAKLPIEQQMQVYLALRDTIAEKRQEKALRVAQKMQKRTERRDKAAREIERKRPSEPKGIFSGLKRGAYEKEVTTWEKARHQASKLAAQASALYAKLVNVARDCKTWAYDRLKQAEPELIRRVEAHRREEVQRKLEQQREQRKEQEKGRDHDRGRGR